MNAAQRLVAVPKAMVSLTAADLEGVERAVTKVVRNEEIFREPAPFVASPHDIGSERVIVAAMRDGWSRPEDVAGVRPGHFYSVFNAHAFAAIQGGARSDAAIAETCARARIGSVERVKAALFELEDRPLWGPVREHADTVLALARRRALIHVAGRIAAAAQRGDVEIDEALRMIRETA